MTKRPCEITGKTLAEQALGIADRDPATSGLAVLSDDDAERLSAYAEGRLRGMEKLRFRGRLRRETALQRHLASLVLGSRGTLYEDILLAPYVKEKRGRSALPGFWDARWVLARWALVSSVVVAVCALAVVTHVRQRPGANPAAAPSVVRGVVQVQGGGKIDFASGTAIQMPDDANGYLCLGDRVRAAVAKSSSLAVLGETGIRLRQGAVWLDVEPNGKGFEVSTDFGWVRVTGTRFCVEAATSKTLVHVLEGTVLVSQLGQPVAVTAGQSLAVDRAGLGLPVARAEGTARPGWVESVAAYGRALSGKWDMQTRAREVRNLQFGMFLHWSLNTFSGTETPVRVADPAFFAATGADTDQWARTAKEAGMRYILFLVKHDDGFCLWDTQTTDFKVTRSPLGVDVLEKLRRSCGKYGLKLALYLTSTDLSCPVEQRTARFRTQISEVLTNYGPIAFLRIHWNRRESSFGFTEAAELVRGLQPQCFMAADARYMDGEMQANPETAPVIQLIDYYSYRDPLAWRQPYRVKHMDWPITALGDSAWFNTGSGRHGRVLNPQEINFVYYQFVQGGVMLSLALGPGPDGRLADAEVRTLREVGGRVVRFQSAGK